MKIFILHLRKSLYNIGVFSYCTAQVIMESKNNHMYYLFITTPMQSAHDNPLISGWYYTRRGNKSNKQWYHFSSFRSSPFKNPLLFFIDGF